MQKTNSQTKEQIFRIGVIDLLMALCAGAQLIIIESTTATLLFC